MSNLVSVKVERQLHEQLQARRVQTGVPLAVQVRRAVAEWLRAEARREATTRGRRADG